MRSALGIIGIVTCLLALPTVTVLAILADQEANPLVMGTIVITALTGMVFIIPGAEQRYLRVMGWIAIAVVASIVWACLVSLTGSLSGPAMSILIVLVAGVLWGRLRHKFAGSAGVKSGVTNRRWGCPSPKSGSQRMATRWRR